MTVFGVFELADYVFDYGPDQFYSLWATRELAEAEARRLAQDTGLSFDVREIEVQDTPK